VLVRPDQFVVWRSKARGGCVIWQACSGKYSAADHFVQEFGRNMLGLAGRLA
jgi:hypothetical protein